MDLGELFDHHLDLPEPGQPLDRTTLPGGGGVCALTDDRGGLVQTLASQSLRRTLALRLDPPPDPGRRRRANLRAVARRLWWRTTHSVFETSLAYLQVARRLAPDRYRKDLAFGPVWFARVDPGDRHPRWVADRFAFSPPTVDVGPFVDRAACRRFVEMLEDLFDLCRHHDLLRQSPSAAACAYKEMGKCPAPCDGSISLDQYRGMIAASVRFASGQSDTKLAQLDRAMRGAASRLQFERAARIREQIARVRKLLAADGRLQRVPAGFRYLVIQRGGGTSRVKPFFIDRGHVRVGEAVQLRRIDAAAGAWADKMRQREPGIDAEDPVERSECIWLVSHFLAKGGGAPGLFLHESGLSTPGNLADRIRRRFAGRPRLAPTPEDPVDGADASKIQ